MAVEIIEPNRSWEIVQTRPGYDVTWKCDAGWLFARVWDRIVVRYLFELVPALTQNLVDWGTGVPTPGSVYPYSILYDNFVPPRRVLRHENKKMLWEVFPALNHPTLLMYLRIPQSQSRGGMTNEVGTPRPDFQDPFGYWMEGSDSDIDTPSEAGRFFIPPARDTEIGLVNQEAYTINPEILFIINQLFLQPFDPDSEFGKKNIARILAKPAQATMGSAGAEPYAMTKDEFRRFFEVEPVQWDGKTAQYKKGDAMVNIAEVV